MRVPTIALALTLAAALPCRAEPLAASRVAADAKWVAHVDFEAARAAILAQEVWKRWLNRGVARDVLRRLDRAVGTDLLDELRGVTFYGSSFDAADGVVLVRAKVDRERIQSLLGRNATHRVTTFGRHSLHAWVQKIDDRMQAAVIGCFARDDLMVLGRDSRRVEHALQVLDGTSPSLASAPSPLASEAPPGTVFHVAAAHVSGFASAGLPFVSPLLGHSELVRISAGESDEDLVVQVELAARSVEAAGYIRDVILGLRAMAALERSDDEAVQSALRALRVAARETTVSVTWRAPGEEIMDLIEREWTGRGK